MRDSLHIVAESTKEIGINGIQLDPGLPLQPTSKFALYVSQLPEQYDNDTYSQFLSDWGTHYTSSATFSGRATMATTITSAYYSNHSNSSIQAQLAIQWGVFGGGGGTASNTTDSKLSSSSSSETHTIGGDSALGSFNSVADWKAWAQTVESKSPAVTSYTLRRFTCCRMRRADHQLLCDCQQRDVSWRRPHELHHGVVRLRERRLDVTDDSMPRKIRAHTSITKQLYATRNVIWCRTCCGRPMF